MAKVVAVSRTIGAGAEEIARTVAAELGFRLVDDEIITRAAEKAGVTPESIEKIERSPSLIDRILNYIAAAPIETGVGFSPPPPDTTHSYEAIIADVIRETARAGKAVILAHGASIPLGPGPGILRVLITASPETRAAALARATHGDEKRALKEVEASDKQRADFIDRFYGVRPELPTHYDFVVNTDRLPPAAAVSVIVQAARAV